MSFITFKEYLHKLEEDTQQDIDALMADLSAVDSQIAQRTAPLMQRKNTLQKQLFMKQKQKEIEDKKNPQPNNTIQQQGTQQQAGTATTTPGGTGQGTPGAQASTAATH